MTKTSFTELSGEEILYDINAKMQLSHVAGVDSTEATRYKRLLVKQMPHSTNAPCCRRHKCFLLQVSAFLPRCLVSGGGIRLNYCTLSEQELRNGVESEINGKKECIHIER